LKKNRNEKASTTAKLTQEPVQHAQKVTLFDTPTYPLPPVVHQMYLVQQIPFIDGACNNYLEEINDFHYDTFGKKKGV
jgi:hypothetical protein